MEVIDIKLFKAKQEGPVLAYANIVIDGMFIIRGIKLIEGKNGRFIAMPSRRLRQEKRAFRDICHPLNQETRDLITEKIFEEYDKQ